MLWVMLIVYIVILTVYVLVQIIFERKENKKSKIAVNAIVVLLLFPLIQFGINYAFHYPDRQKQDEFQSEVVKSLVALGQKEIDLKKVQEIIAQTHKQVFNSISKEADKWASDFVNTLPQKKEQFKLINEKEKDFSDKSIIYVPQLFTYLLSQVDARITELKKRGIYSNVISESYELFINMDASSTSYKQYIVRKVIFDNGSIIEVVFKPGRFSKGVVTFYPEMDFIGSPKNHSGVSFGVNRGYGGFGGGRIDIVYAILHDPLSEEFMSQFARSLNQLFESVLAQ